MNGLAKALLAVGGIALVVLAIRSHEQPRPQQSPEAVAALRELEALKATVAARSPSNGRRVACSPAEIEIRSIQAKFVDPCTTRACPSMKGVGVLVNRCSEAVGVQLKLVAEDGSGNPVAASDFWPASTTNIPPGEYTFSLDSHLEHDPRIRRFSLAPIAVEKWPER